MKSLFTRFYRLFLRPFRWFLQTRKRNKVITIILVLVAIGVIIWQVRKANAAPQYVLQKVTRGDIIQLVSETGNVHTTGRVDVYSSATGIIEEIYVANGETVEINQDLFKVRSTATDQEKAAAYASYTSAVSTLKTAEQGKITAQSQLEVARKAILDAQNAANARDNNRGAYNELQNEGVTSTLTSARQSFAAAEKKYTEADQAIAAGKASVSSTWLAYQATQNVIVRSTSSGTVVNAAVREGDMVNAKLAATTSVPILTIANLETYSIQLSLNEVDIPKVTLGQTAQLTLDAFPGKKFRGVVSHVDMVGTNAQGVITYNSIIDITNPEQEIRPGMTANVDIEVDKAENVLTVPNSAIKPYQGKKAVQVIDPKTKKLTFIPVEIGIKSPKSTEIKSGVKEGIDVVTGVKNGAVKTATP